jgi:hypothetical protein
MYPGSDHASAFAFMAGTVSGEEDQWWQSPLCIEDLRGMPFWDRYFQIVEIFPGVENAYARNQVRAPLAA